MDIKIKLIIALALICLIQPQYVSAQCDSTIIYAATWNVENLFDTIDDTDKNDEEFLPWGEKNWTDSKLAKKTKNIAKVIRYMNVMEGPDLLALQEVEHESLLSNMLDKYFCDKNYKLVYSESLDTRGIDNALIYNAEIFQLLNSENIEVTLKGERTTRYILYSKLLMGINDTIHIFANHWPSRSGGQEKSEPNRIKAADVLYDFLTKNNLNNVKKKIIILGDFNDEPSNISITGHLQVKTEYKNIDKSFTLINLAYSSKENGEGSYLYRGNWNMLDQIIVSNAVFQSDNFYYISNSFEVIKPYFMITGEGKYKGAAIPTYGGQKYLGGFSDHFPVGIKIKYIPHN